MEDVEIRIKKREAEIEGRDYMPPLQTSPTHDEWVREDTRSVESDNEFEQLEKNLEP